MDDLQGVRDVIDNWIKYNVDKNLDALLSLYDNHYCGFGTAENEIDSTREELIEHWMRTFQAEKIEMSNLQIYNLHVSNNIAWCMLSLTLSALNEGIQIYNGNLRMTMVLKKIDDRWVFDQSHASVPQIGVMEKGFPTREGIRAKIDELINGFDLYPKHDSKVEQVMKYLEKARELAANITT